MAGMNYRLNFSWVIEGQLAGHQGVVNIDDLRWLKQQGIQAMVRLIEKNQAEVTAEQIEAMGIWDCHEPITDFGAPTPEQIDRIIRFIQKAEEAGRPVSVSCRAGIGRTGTILACVLVSKGYDADTAIKEVSKKRSGSIEMKNQELAVHEYAASLGQS
ncbi:cyclindependent kinase inhibitor [Dehalogenimonas sp. WBC-2]|nr:cyclindependent kinase inhibitor [Dehalogenimonas sp. WBC-2]